jgi:hypothetical protein
MGARPNKRFNTDHLGHAASLREQLSNLTEYPDERNNLPGAPAYADLRGEMRDRLLKAVYRTGHVHDGNYLRWAYAEEMLHKSDARRRLAAEQKVAGVPSAPGGARPILTRLVIATGS